MTTNATRIPRNFDLTAAAGEQLAWLANEYARRAQAATTAVARARATSGSARVQAEVERRGRFLVRTRAGMPYLFVNRDEYVAIISAPGRYA